MTRSRRGVVSILLGVLLLAPLVPAPASADLSVNWATWLPSFVSEFNPASADDCIAGRDKCVRKTIKEMDKLVGDLASSCAHTAVFSMAYLRITQGYHWIRDVDDPDGSPQYEDRASMNFVVEVFARAYLHAFEQWRSGGTPPAAWRMAFDAATAKQVTGNGDLLLGINAHINRDLPFVMAAAGLVAPDGTSRKPDYDKVNELLDLLTSPLAAEEAARFDPDMDNDDSSIADPATFQTIVGWRERAWRNAEALVSAGSDAERELVAQLIENDAAAEAAAIMTSTAYVPPLTSTTRRDEYCAVHHADPPPKPYPFDVG